MVERLTHEMTFRRVYIGQHRVPFPKGQAPGGAMASQLVDDTLHIMMLERSLLGTLENTFRYLVLEDVTGL